MLPRILIDASRYGHPTPTGVEVYSDMVINTLVADTSIASTRWGVITPVRKNLPKEVVQVVIPMKRLWTILRLSLFFFMHHKDHTLVVPSHILPLFLPKKRVVVIHDVAFMREPASYSSFQRWLLIWSTKRARKKATTIITVSEATKKDLLHFFPEGKDNIKVVHSGIDAEGYRNAVQKDATSLLRKHHLTKGSYYIYIGRMEHKKNTPLLIKEFLASKASRHSKLVLIGKPGVGFDDLKEDMNHPSILYLGYQPQEIAATLLAHAKALVFPSKYEGFGFPVLESFAVETPVICSNKGALPEVGGDVALYFDPEVPGQLQDLLDSSHSFPSSTKMQKQLQNFSWNRTVHNIWEIIT